MDGIDAIVTGEDLRMLADIGFSAISRGQAATADAIFAGLTAARPDNEAGPIGTALVHLQRGQAEEAAAVLRRFPGSDAAQLFLGMALHRAARRVEARAVLEALAATALDPGPAQAARLLLTEV